MTGAAEDKGEAQPPVPLPRAGQRATLATLQRAFQESVRRDGPDLSARQFALLLTVYMTPPPHTVRGLAQRLNMSKAAVVRGLDTLGRYGMLRRRRDEQDRRNVLVHRTVKGSVYLSEFAELVRREETA